MTLVGLTTADSRQLLFMGVMGLALIGQALAIYAIRRRSAKRDQLFRVITENAADMIALVDLKGRRQYNSPSYKRTLGYSPAELSATSAFEQIHPDDRFKVLEAARSARETGVGKRLEYRLRHKNGTWRILESSASAIRNAKGEVEQLVIVNRDVTERKQAERQLEHNALHDPVTGLPNRRLCMDRLQRCFAREQREAAYRFAVLLIGIDDFATLNDCAGPLAVDPMIAEIARRIESELRLDDSVSHSAEGEGGESTLLSRFEATEFTILLENTLTPSDAMRVAQRVQTAISKPLELPDRELVVSVSIGIALSTSPHEGPEDLLRDASVAVRRAQARGGGRCEVFDELMHTHAVRRLALEDDLARALERSEFVVYYQPVVKLHGRQLSGFEALLRWKHPQKGLISPYDFLDVAEDIGLIALIDQWVIEQACHHLCCWQRTCPAARQLNLAVNLSARQLANPNLVQEFRAAAAKSSISLDRLQVEIAEHVAMSDPKLACNVLLQFKHLGVARILDDFGSGSSSLHWLQRFPLTTLKIDRSIVSSMAFDRTSRELLGLIAAVSGRLNLSLSAEGIEAVTQIDPLIDAGCECGQGYLFSQPVEATRAEAMLRSPSWPAATRQ
jgi:PAS domain S-box-containing protein/diguanylate cyclase (GGDEF)-like protein